MVHKPTSFLTMKSVEEPGLASVHLVGETKASVSVDLLVLGVTDKCSWVPSKASESSVSAVELVCPGYAKPNDVIGFKCLTISFCSLWCFLLLAPLSYRLLIVRIKELEQ